jgi:hypothetical protein
LYHETYPIWRGLFGENFLALSYDELISDPVTATVKAVAHIHPALSHLVPGHVGKVGVVHPSSALVSHDTLVELRGFYNRSQELFFAMSGLPRFTETCRS